MIQNNDSDTEVTIDGVVAPKTIITKEILENDYKISYHISDLNKYFVLKTDGVSERKWLFKKLQ